MKSKGAYSVAVVVAVIFGVIEVASGTPTPSGPFPTPVSGGGGGAGGAGGQLLSPAEEPAITMFPFNGGQRSVVFANFNQFATYDVVDGSFQLVTTGSAPNPGNFDYTFDPVAVTQPNTGYAYIGAAAHRGTGDGLVLVWRSTDGVNWSAPIVVAEYFQENPPERSWADKPWMDVSPVSGRMWMVWRTLNVAGSGPYCIATSLNGLNWSSCVTPAPGQGAMSVAVDGPHSAVAIWDTDGVVKSSRCTASGLTVTCGAVQDIGPRIDVQGDELISGLRAGSLFTIAGDDATGTAIAVWGGESQGPGQPVHARVVWSERTGGVWSTPQPITGPTNDQIMPEVAFARQPGEFFVTLYQRQGPTSTTFNVVAYQREKLTGNWVSLGTVGNPVTANMDPMFFGDYSWMDCPNLCAVAFTGTNTTPNPDTTQIEVHLVGAIRPTADAWVREVQSSTNFGLDDELIIGKSINGKGATNPYRDRILMDFDISAQIPNNTNVSTLSAVLHMYKSSESLYPDPAMVLYRNEVDEVDEGAVTWNTHPDVESFPGPIVWDLPVGTGWTTLDVKNFILSCKSFQGGKCSWQLRWINEVDNAVAAETFPSRDNPALNLRPYLEIHYDIP